MSRAPSAAVLSVVLSLFLIPGCARNAPAQQPTPRPDAQARGDGARGRQPAPRPYARVITDRALTSSGIVKVQRVDDTPYFQLPRDVIGRDMVILRRLAGGTDTSNT